MLPSFVYRVLDLPWVYRLAGSVFAPGALDNLEARFAETCRGTRRRRIRRSVALCRRIAALDRGRWFRTAPQCVALLEDATGAPWAWTHFSYAAYGNEGVIATFRSSSVRANSALTAGGDPRPS